MKLQCETTVCNVGNLWKAAYKIAVLCHVKSCVGTNDNMTKFCTSSLLCDAVLRLPCLVLVGFGPGLLSLLNGQRMELHIVEGSGVVTSLGHPLRCVVVL